MITHPGTSPVHPCLQGHYILSCTAHSRELPRTITPALGDPLQPLIQICHPPQLRLPLMDHGTTSPAGMHISPAMAHPSHRDQRCPCYTSGVPCAGSVSPSTTLLLPHATVQWNTGMSNAFSIHILCFTTAPALFPCHKPCSIIHIPSSPHSPSSRLSRYSLSQQFAECCEGRLCGNDSYRQRCWHLGRSTSLFQPLQGALGVLGVLKIQSSFSQKGREGISQGSDHFLSSHEEVQTCW